MIQSHHIICDSFFKGGSNSTVQLLIFVEHCLINNSYAMMAKPIKTLELRYPIDALFLFKKSLFHENHEYSVSFKYSHGENRLSNELRCCNKSIGISIFT